MRYLILLPSTGVPKPLDSLSSSLARAYTTCPTQETPKDETNMKNWWTASYAAIVQVAIASLPQYI